MEQVISNTNEKVENYKNVNFEKSDKAVQELKIKIEPLFDNMNRLET